MLEKRSIELLLKHCCPSEEVDKVDWINNFAMSLGSVEWGIIPSDSKVYVWKQSGEKALEFIDNSKKILIDPKLVEIMRAANSNKVAEPEPGPIDFISGILVGVVSGISSTALFLGAYWLLVTIIRLFLGFDFSYKSLVAHELVTLVTCIMVLCSVMVGAYIGAVMGGVYWEKCGIKCMSQ